MNVIEPEAPPFQLYILSQQVTSENTLCFVLYCVSYTAKCLGPSMFHLLKERDGVGEKEGRKEGREGWRKEEREEVRREGGKEGGRKEGNIICSLSYWIVLGVND